MGIVGYGMNSSRRGKISALDESVRARMIPQNRMAELMLLFAISMKMFLPFDTRLNIIAESQRITTNIINTIPVKTLKYRTSLMINSLPLKMAGVTLTIVWNEFIVSLNNRPPHKNIMALHKSTDRGDWFSGSIFFIFLVTMAFSKKMVKMPLNITENKIIMFVVILMYCLILNLHSKSAYQKIR